MAVAKRVPELSPEVLEKIDYLCSRYYAYWVEDGQNWMGIRKRGYNGLLSWHIQSPEGNKTSHSVVEVARRMLKDPDSYGL